MKAIGVNHGSTVVTVVMTDIANWKITIWNGKSHYKRQFSIVMLNYQRVDFAKI